MKELKVSEEIQDIFLEYQVLLGCRDEAIRSLFKAKRAIYYGKKAEKARRKFWRMAYELYPETKDGEWSYFVDGGVLKNSNE